MSYRSKAMVLAVVALAVLLAACGSSGSDASSGDATATTSAAGGTDASAYRIAFFSDSDDNAWVQAGLQAAEDVATETGVQVDTFSAGWDASKQLTQVQDAIATGKYDAYVVESIDGETLCKPFTDLIDDGEIVSVFNTPLCGDVDTLYTEGAVGYFGRDEYEGGRLLGEQLADAVGGSGQVAYVSGPVANSIVQVTTKGFKDALAEHPGVELVAEVTGDWDAGKGLAATQDVVQAHPDIDGIAYGVDQMMVPSVEWLKESGSLGDIEIVTEGGSTNAFTMIEAGEVHAAVAGLPYTEAYNAMMAAVATLTDQPIDVPGWDSTTKVADYLEDPMFGGGTPVITDENVSKLEAEWSAA